MKISFIALSAVMSLLSFQAAAQQRADVLIRHAMVVDVEHADNGPGIPPDQREKVFVPFFTTKRMGSGVGLTLVRQIASVHGGLVVISEAEGGGTVVSMKL